MAFVAPQIVVGVATYTGVTGTVVTGNLTATKNKLTGAALTRTTPTAELKDGSGNVFAKAYARQTDSLALTITPVATPGTNTMAEAAANVVLPANGTLVTLADTGIAAFDGDWNYDGNGTITPQSNGEVKITMTVSRMGDLTGVNPGKLAPLA